MTLKLLNDYSELSEIIQTACNAGKKRCQPSGEIPVSAKETFFLRNRNFAVSAFQFPCFLGQFANT